MSVRDARDVMYLIKRYTKDRQRQLWTEGTLNILPSTRLIVEGFYIFIGLMSYKEDYLNKFNIIELHTSSLKGKLTRLNLLLIYTFFIYEIQGL